MPGYFLAPYNSATGAVIRFPLVKRGVVDLAATADYTAANSDCNISKDGAAQANPANNIAIITGTTWGITLSGAELTAKEIDLMVVDAATKAVEDQWIAIKTYGNVNAFFQGDITAANIDANLKQVLGTAVTAATAGILDVNTKNVGNNTVTNSVAMIGVNVVNFGGTAVTGRDIGASVLLSPGTGTGQIQLTTGNVTVQTVANNGIAEVSFAANAISGAKVANNVAIQSVTGNVGNVTSNVGGSVAGSVASVTGNVANVTGNIGGNVAGTVGSVTGNVAAVTGSIGGNLAGSVGSVIAAVSITSNIKKNQALSKFEFLMTDSTTHAPKTGLTVTCTRSIDGGAYGAGTLANIAELSNGIYVVDFGAGDLNGNVITLRATAAASDDTVERIVTQP